MSRRVVAALLVASALTACEHKVALPEDSTLLKKVERYRFGDATHARETRAMVAAMNKLEPVYGPLRTGTRELPAATSPEMLWSALGTDLANKGWAVAPELAAWNRPDSFAFGWRSGSKVYAIVGLRDGAGDAGSSPVTILTNIGDPGLPV